MNINTIELFINELSTNGFLKEDDYQYILFKASELNVSESFVNEYLKAAGIKLKSFDSQSKDNNNTVDYYSQLNEDVRLKIAKLKKEKNYSELVHIFESEFFNTSDTFLIEQYLFALNEDYPKERVHQQTKIFYEKFPKDIRILNICYQIALEEHHYSESLDFLFQLNKLGENAQQQINNVLSQILLTKNWSLFQKYSQTKDFKELLNEYLKNLYNNKNYKNYAELFDTCENNYSEDLKEKFVVALLNINEYGSAKSVCSKLMITSKVPILNAYMGIACENIGEYHDAVFYYEKAISNGLNYQENLSNVKNAIQERELKSKRDAERKAHNARMAQIEEEENLRNKREAERQEELENNRSEQRRKREEEEESKKREEEEESDNYKEELRQQYKEEMLKIKDEAQQSLDSARENIDNIRNGTFNDRHEFSSSVTRGGDIINPDKIIIEDGKVTWKKRSKILIGGETITIPIDKIESVDLQTGIIGSDIIIRGTGRGRIRAENFSTSDAKQIKSLLGF